MQISNYTEIGLHPVYLWDTWGYKNQLSDVLFGCIKTWHNIAQNRGFKAQFEYLTCDPLKRYLLNVLEAQQIPVVLLF